MIPTASRPRKISCLALAGAALLSACQQDAQAPPADGAGKSNAGSATPATPTGTSPPRSRNSSEDVLPPFDQPPPGYTDGSGVNENYPDLTPVPLEPEGERTETGARNVLISFARAIELREYDQAWNMLGSAAKAQWTRTRFNDMFDGMDDLLVAVPGGTMETAAGSMYYAVPTTITGSDAEGRPVRLEGEVVLRRANDVPGASTEDLRWHIETVTLDWTH